MVSAAACVDRHPFCGSPPPNAPLTTSTRPLRERCCGYFWRQWEALSHLCMRCRLTFLILFQSLLFFSCFSCSHPQKTGFPATSACTVRPSVSINLCILVETCFCRCYCANTERKEQRSSYGVVAMVP